MQAPSNLSERPEWRLSVAPMMDWTDRHCRSFHRALNADAWLYTEMITSQAIAHGDRDALLGMGEEGERTVLQLGGSDPAELAEAARTGARYGYREINLNCGCPSDRVRQGAFGACLMAQPALVADCVAAMRDAVDLPVTVKHRIGIDRGEDFGFVEDFVGTVAEAGCRRFIVHARNAWLGGLSPKQNREVPPLRYSVVDRLAARFGQLRFELNGGLQSLADVRRNASGLDGAMLGRVAYHQPWLLAMASRSPPTRDSVIDSMHRYLVRRHPVGVRLRHLARHMLGLYHGQPAARRWRRMLSDPLVLASEDPDALLRARDLVQSARLAHVAQ